jgi:phosphotransferase system enzyme I (PtsI)
VSRALRRYAKVFQTLDKGFLSDRANDIFDIEKRVLRQLLGRRREELAELVSPVIVLAYNLTPSETANLSPDFVHGFVTETGGPGSHTAIVAAALEIPAVIGTGPFLTDVSGGDLVIIDGDQGLVILQPDEETIARYRHEVEEHRSRAMRLRTLRDLPAETADGQRIALYGNIEFPHEVDHCVDRGADGIGLYRTEFLYVGSDLVPDEEAHYRAYAQVIEAMAGRPVIIRTLDMGADKIMEGFESMNNERNPCLGLRSIRLSLANLPLFRTQLRAVLRASVLGDVRIMFPLVSTLTELRKAKMVLADVMEDLEEQHTAFNRQMPVGMMVETPAAVMLIDRFAAEVDFLSIGTNDLVQYTLAVDRGNKEVADLYNPADPAILRLIKIAIDAGGKDGIPVNVCGQMSANPIYTMLLLGLGLRGFSVPPSAVPEIKKVCRTVNIPACVAAAGMALTMESALEIKSYLRGELLKILPEMVG